MTKYIYSIMYRARSLSTLVFVSMLSSLSLYGQNSYLISGTVTNTTGEPIIGATISIEGTNIGAVSDLDGTYSFNASISPGEYTLIARSVGYASVSNVISLDTNKELSFNFILAIDILNLDEVVVTGTSAGFSRKQLGNSIATVKADDFKDSGSENPLASLSGRAMGVQITQNQGNAGGGFSVRLRGTSTINGSSEPLYMVDGVIVDNSSQNVINLNADGMGTGFQAGQNRLIDINPNDIERIEVINGAAAAAIYGSRASNGVVQIFTKKGLPGDPEITFNSSITISQLRKRIELNTYGKRFGIPGSNRLSTTQDRLTTIADLRSEADREANPGTGPNALAGRPLVKDTYDVTRYDWQDQIFSTALGTENYLSIKGGNGSTNYFASGSYMVNEGIITNTDFQRYGVRLRMDQNITDILKASVGLTYNNSSSNDSPNGNNFFGPISAMTISDNVWNITERDVMGNLLGVEPTRMNPLTAIEEFQITQETNRVISDLQLNYFPTDKLNVNYLFGIDNYTLQGNTFQPRTPYPANTAFFSDGYASVATSNVFKINHDLNAVHQTSFGSITLSTILGAQFQYDKTGFSAIEGRDLSSFVTTTEAITNQFNLPQELSTERSIWGYFLQETIGYNDFLFLTLAGRMDGASSFGKDERNQFYPKASGSFVLSDLDIWQNIGLTDIISTFKLRASWGKAGNLTAIDPYARNTPYIPISLTGRSGFLQSSTLGDSNIKPEVMTESELGADMAFFNNRIGLQFTYYSQDIEDLILLRELAPSQGGSSILTNIGKMTNKGIEMMVSASPVKTPHFQWDASFLLSTFENKVSGIGGGRAGITLRGGGGTQSAIDGQPLGVFFGRYYARKDDGSLLLSPEGLPQVERGDDKNGIAQRDSNGQPTGDPLRKVLGDPNPEYIFTLVNNVKYKKFSFRIQFDATQGFDMYNWDSVTRNNVGSGKLAEQELRGEVPRGWVAAVGGFIGPRIQEYHVEDASYIKLREIALSYGLGRIGNVENINLTLIGRNLASFDNYTGFDPETNSAGQSSKVRGDDFGNIPIPRTYQFKITIEF